MHQWESEWFEKNGSDFNHMMDWFATWARRFRLGGCIKEKYGTLRFYCQFHYSLHDLIWPGYFRTMWARPFEWIDSLYRRWEKYNFIHKAIIKLQLAAYVWLYQQAITRWPQFREEILCMADHKELFPLPLQREAYK